MQEGLSAPVAVLLNEVAATLQVANAYGYRYFTSEQSFKEYVRKEGVGQGERLYEYRGPAAGGEW